MTCTVLNIMLGFFGGLIVAYHTQKLIEKRERRNRRDDLRLELYLDVVDLVLDNERELAERSPEGKTASMELQTKRKRISHRLKLLASKIVQDAYKAYHELMVQETEYSVKDRPKNIAGVHRAQDQLIKLMAKDVQNT